MKYLQTELHSRYLEVNSIYLRAQLSNRVYDDTNLDVLYDLLNQKLLQKLEKQLKMRLIFL